MLPKQAALRHSRLPTTPSNLHSPGNTSSIMSGRDGYRELLNAVNGDVSTTEPHCAGETEAPYVAAPTAAAAAPSAGSGTARAAARHRWNNLWDVLIAAAAASFRGQPIQTTQVFALNLTQERLLSFALL
jgi:hypothetical protein